MTMPSRLAVAAILLALALVAAFATRPALAFEDTLAQRLLACTGCHGKEGRAAADGYYPRIAGKPEGYLVNQLGNFREGRRHYAPMQALLDPLAEPYLREIAQHFAQLELPYPPPQPPTAPPALLERGRRLAVEGDGSRQLPACAACHGTRLTGIAPAVPGLLGLPRDYLNGQLGNWRNGARHAAAPDCMAEIARRLAPEDVAALTQWLAAQPVPADAKAPATAPSRWPLECGSVTTTAAAADKGEPTVAATTSRPAVPSANAGAAAITSPTAGGASIPPADRIARGAYLARAGDCAACHTSGGGAAYAGGRAIETPFGSVYASNLTPDERTGLGRWSSEDFWAALHEGRAPAGRLLYPAFPYPNYTLVSRDDSDALFAYLKSLPPVAQPNRPHALRFPYGTQAALRLWRALYFEPSRFVPAQARGEAWNRGAYLVQGLGHCNACHASRNALGATAGPLDLGGGLIPVQNWYAPSLASPHEAGVGGWPLERVTRLLATGVTEGASTLGPMAEVVQGSTRHLSPADLGAMASYLQSLPSPAAVPPPAPPAPLDPLLRERGAALYERHCVGCHGKQGEGVAGAYPALAGNRAVTMAVPANLVHVVLEGGFPPATPGNPRPYGMPPFAPVLSDADIAALLSFLRRSWGNTAEAVTLYEVQRYRTGR